MGGILRTRLHRAEVKAGPLIVLGIVVLAAIGFWVYRAKSGDSSSNWVKEGDSFAAWCEACKKDITFSAADAKKVAKQGDKLQCPICQKFEARWGPAPLGPTPTGDSGVMQP